MEKTHINLWEDCLEIFKDNLPTEQFDAWFKPITSISFDGRTLKLMVPTSFFVEQLEEKYMKLLAPTLRKVYGPKVQLFYQYDTVAKDPTSSVTIESSRPSPAVQPHSVNPFKTDVVADFDSQLNPRYTFENYCGSISNKIARSIGEAIASNPKCKTFNPLFIFGPTGVGKTHLIQAIGIRIKERNPQSRVLYVSARLFESQYTTAATAKPSRINDFINFYQSIDVLIIDDIQDLMRKTATQNAFFHIFNHLHQNQRQIILSSDCAPSEMMDMHDRLLSRFKWGMTAELERPDLDLRREVLTQKASQDGLDLPCEVIEYIAANVTDSIRELEGIVVSLMAHATVLGKEVTLDLAQSVLANAVKIQRKTVNFEMIAQCVSDYYNIEPDQLFTKNRKREISDARQMVMYLSKRHAKMPVTAIGARLSRTHATVLHACRNIEERLSLEAALRDDVSKIEASLTC
ncbi:chromosomal replication initiator protein DnaA [Muribaculum gordoncarteri]|jgi:chromosomal replication initiator protein|uniref:Chromosomal replication initiator protein DnaA n=19 Tax=Muribaculum TaxID=1918540 RepID=A0A4P7VGA5_9BACT|nr:chromosomal replication initiator protein DnaA [Muribaculum gordoncarteri]QCD34904.1 chromosomal replication initiator protein DnaA [Muribaculum gordoncarteri]